ncbi:hypothetical protein ALQ20_03701 [Pseudomonas syringae pv. atrofaciens]|nr:hypothetical protein ALQ20_03701 [Pseudomonas syringae pv. atrofaciens]
MLRALIVPHAPRHSYMLYWAGQILVGVSLLTKALVQTPYLRGLHRPLREQARSHEELCLTLSAEHVAGTYRSSRSASQLHAVLGWTEILVGVSLLTQALVQTPYLRGLHRPLREQARSHEELCVTLSAEHVAGTYRSSRSASQLRAASRWTEIFVGVSLLTKALVQTPYLRGLHRPLREQARSHEDLCVTLSAAHRHDGVLRDTSRSACFSVAMHFGDALRHMALMAIRHARE